jgi:hypothetical protein
LDQDHRREACQGKQEGKDIASIAGAFHVSEFVGEAKASRVVQRKIDHTGQPGLPSGSATIPLNGS